MRDGWYGLRSSDRLLHAGAFNWTFTLGTGLMDPWTCGATALIASPGTPLDALPALLAASKATIFAAAPGVYRRLLRADIPELEHLRHGLSAGEALPEHTRTAWRSRTGTDIFEAFGMSECSTFVSAAPGKPAATGALGRPQPGRRVALLDSSGAPSQAGTIAVHRSDPGLMLGYLEPAGTLHKPLRGDWFETGDLGRRLPGGDIVYAGRADDMMNAGGYRVSPLEVEGALQPAAGLRAIAAIEVEIKPGVQVIAALYTADPDCTASVMEERLRALAIAGLADYKRPRIYLRKDALPTSPNGKLQRKLLRDTFEVPHDKT